MCFVRNIHHPDGAALTNLAFGTWEPGGSTEGGTGIVKAPEGAPVLLSGQFLRYDNKKPIENAVLIVLKPGIKVGSLTRQNLKDNALTVGVSGKNGKFETVSGIAPGKYSVVAAAEGYTPILEDDALEVPAGASSPFTPFGDGLIYLRK
jgi:hypothetical protein